MRYGDDVQRPKPLLVGGAHYRVPRPGSPAARTPRAENLDGEHLPPLRQPLADLLRREADGLVGDEVRDLALVPVVVACALEQWLAELDEVLGRRIAQEAEEREGTLEVVDHRRPAQEGGR